MINGGTLRRACTGAAAVATALVLAARLPVSAATPSGPVTLQLTAPSALVTELRYVGTATMDVGGQTVTVLRWSLASATYTDPVLLSACVDGVRSRTVGTGPVISGASTFEALSLSAVVGGQPVTFTPSSPPTAALPSPVQLDQLDLVGTSLQAASLAVPAPAVDPLAC